MYVNQIPYIFWLDPAGNMKSMFFLNLEIALLTTFFFVLFPLLVSRWNLFSVGQPVNTFSNTVSHNRPSIAYYNNEL